MVIASNECKGYPNASKESGWMWYCKSGQIFSVEVLAKAPNWEGAILIGPYCVNKYLVAIDIFPNKELEIVFKVSILLTL
jgi:hypothetical protein